MPDAPSGPTGPDGIARWVHRRAVSVREHPAIIFRDTEISYGELADRIDRLAGALRSRGVGPGDRIAYLGNNHPSFVEALFGGATVGAALVPLNTRLSRAELSYMLSDSGTRLLIVTAELEALGQSAADAIEMLVVADGVDAVVAPGGPLADPVRSSLDDPALIIYTSGTTGRPKGAVLSHGNLTWNALNVLADYDVISTDRALMISPLFHVASLGMGLLPVLMKGATVLLQERFVPADALAAIERQRATTISGVPTTFQLLADAPEWPTTDISSLRLLTCGGSPVPVRIREAWQARGLAFSSGYGMTETSPGATMLPAAHATRKAESVGIPHFFAEVRLDGEGEVEVRGPMVFTGYWNADDKTRGAFTDDGWLRTGDMGRLDHEGFLTIADRVKDMIISGGENIYSAEVEQALLELDGVTGAAVIGVAHEIWGEVPHAVVTLRAGATLDPEEMVAALSERLARYKVPRSLEVVEELPRTASGKVQKQALRDRYAKHSLLDGLSEPFENLDSAGARAALREHWGIEGPDPVRLDTERDDTFRAGDVLLKVAHPTDDPAVIEMQSAALAHVAATDPGIPVQRVVAALDGSQSATVVGRHARVLTWLDGDIAADQDLPVAFFETAGRMLGRLNRALASFQHPGAHRDLAWDLLHLPDLRTHATAPLHLEVIDRFTAETLPALAGLPHQVIHNDSHPGNLLVRAGALAGILDFGDAVYSPRVCDLAVALTYLVPDGPRPWPTVDAFAAGFLAEVPLSDAELAQLPMLMAARTIMRSVMNQALHRQAHSDPHGFYAANDRKLHQILKGA